MKPRNFPERKRQRQFAALDRLSEKTRAGVSNSLQISALLDRVSADLRSVRTKKDRSAFGRFRTA